jgi:regulation of enolase protein 1 (concanavalin A-like superfamily)
MQTPPTSLFEPAGSSIDPRFQWHGKPASWSFESAARTLSIRTTENGDFWQRTHYGFRADNGHFLWTAAALDFDMAVEVSMQPLHQYDQAGLMVRLSPDCWLKTSVEYEDGSINRLGCVVTNRGYSDWSTQDVSASVTDFALRVKRRGADYHVEAQLPGASWSQLRLAHLDEDDGSAAVECGVYACSPKEPGFTSTFRRFSLYLPSLCPA